MLKFMVFGEDGLDDGLACFHSYLIGSDQHAIRANISFKAGNIVCEKRESGAAALALEYEVAGCGRLLLQTCLLPERQEPYLLSLELARRRLLLFYNKIEDWSMFEARLDPSVVEPFELARGQFIEALCDQHDDCDRANQLANRCLVTAIEASELFALARADLLLARRTANGLLSRYPVGCGVKLDQQVEPVRDGLADSVDFLLLPMSWKELTPHEGRYRWDLIDRWYPWLKHNRVPVIAGPVVSFESHLIPDWLFIWEHDYETIRDLVYEHTERVVARYRNLMTVWNVVSGLHMNSHFGFNFDQLMELSRMTTMLVKKIQPAARVLVEICHPFGEYYAANHRSIPPLMYADLLIQSAVSFDGFVIKLLMGPSAPGRFSFTRDLMQISHLLDQYAGYGKPVTLVVGVPSGQSSAAAASLAGQEQNGDTSSGYWHGPWSESIQGRWLEAVFKIALSKPFIDAVAWCQWADRPDMELPMAGLVDSQLKPKNALDGLAAFRRTLAGSPGRPH